MADYRDDLFAAYDQHTAVLDPSDSERLEWFRAYARANYFGHLGRLDPSSATVLEVGSNKGHLLKVLYEAGFKNLTGVDVSEAEVQLSRRLVPEATLHAVDMDEYLQGHAGEFDVIVMKAVLEHVQKSDVIPVLRRLREGLRDSGTLIVDVPNMDWLFASHERYMDFTHEVGFTQESLRQVFIASFGDVEIHSAESYVRHGWARRKRDVARAVLDRLFTWADGEGSQAPIWARSLVAVARR